MNREAAIKLILKLIGIILETYRCSISREGQQWLLRHGDFSSLYPDQMSAVIGRLRTRHRNRGTSYGEA